MSNTEGARPSGAVRLLRLIPGIVLAGLLGLGAMWVGQAWSVPSVLVALALGIGLSFLFDRPALAGGIEVSARDLLRVGVALLGARVTFSEIAAMSWAVPVILAATVLCLFLGVRIGKMCGLSTPLATVSAGAVAICGASAALAVSSAFPPRPNGDAESATVVAGVTVLGTIAMIAYPLLSHLLGFDADETGILLGASLHEVAQAVGAGFAVSDDVGHVATTAKLVRVAALAPLVLLVGWMVTARASRDPGATRPPLLPWYLIAFIALAAIASFNLFDPRVADAASQTSRFFLLTAIAALGLKTSPEKLIRAGPALIGALVLQSLLLLGLVVAGVFALRLIAA